jgi:membrane dipeptidase
MSGNGVPLSQDWVSVQEELRYIRIFFQLGVRIMHLTYNRRNMIGDGCAEPSNAGLSDFGREVVREMNRVGVIVDVAHAGWQTSLEAAKASEKPMVASHSGCCAVNAHIRCKPDDVIRAIVDSGGYVGICCIPAFLGRGGDIHALLDHVDHVAQTFGTNHVTIGTDTAYTSRHAAAERRKVPQRQRGRPRWAYFWPPGALGGESEDPGARQSLAWTNWPMFTVGLVQRGYTDEDIRKILGGNMLRVAKAVFPESGPSWSS